MVVVLLTGILAQPASASSRKTRDKKQDRSTLETTTSTTTESTTADLATTTDSTSSEPIAGETLTAPEIVEEPATTETVEEPAPSPEADDGYDAAASLGSMYNLVDQIGARQLWTDGVTGAGIDVAVIDTGIAPVAALSDPDKIAAVVDLSFEAEVPEPRYLDTYGHGSHIAGIIAGRDPDADPATAAQQPSEFLGVAPDARLVSVKVADNTGAVDVSQVIAAIDWVVQHRNDGDLNIRVLNLSYGTDGTQGYRTDPLAAAVERAWDAGIVVVVAAGNEGWHSAGLANPAVDPYVITVGGAQPTDDGAFRLPDWSSRGEFATVTDDGTYDAFWTEEYAGRYPDLLAPGVSVESLRVPGSRVALEHPEGHVADALLKGSGTSQAAAVVSGSAALLLQQRPELTPDQVKALLTSTADRLPFYLTISQGSGVINVAKAAAAPTPDAEAVRQTWARSTGTGSLEAARGTQHVILDGVELSGEITAWGDPWDGQAIVDAALAGSSWSGSSWTGSSWTGSSWSGSSWTGSSWTGSSWTGSSWTGSSWSGSSWTGSSWTGSSWTGSSWTGSSWSGSSWTGSSWTGAGWN
jgi:serine protease AprX